MGRAVAGLESVASVVQRLAVLLAAGVVPASGWAYLADDDRGDAERGDGNRGNAAGGGLAVKAALRVKTDGSIVRAVASAAAGGEPIADSIIAAIDEARVPDEQAWRGLAAAWQVATDAGASLAPSLRELATSLRDLAQTQREFTVALAAPVATARMVLMLPVVGVLFGLALGFNTLGTLFTTVPGAICLALGGALMLVARAWNRRLVRRAQPVILTPGLTLDLMAIAVSGGASLSRATATVAAARRSCGLADDGSDGVVESVLSLSRRAGVPAAALLRSEAEEQRRTARSEGQRTAATLAVTLMLPLGLCILPAFMLLGVAPLLIAVVSSTVSAI